MPSNNASSAPESPVIPKAQENPWYIRHFTKLLIGFGLGGGAAAILLPWTLWLLCGMSSGSSDQLRLHLLYVTGGIIAVLTLLQTNWKNQGDRLKIDADIKKNEQDAEKNERDHIRQVHAERRSRYTKAVEQLANEKAAVRLGGIYTLVSLVDEWLTDDSLDPKEQQNEGQVIINSLCAYIRSPFPLSEIQEYIDSLNSFPNYKDIYSEDNVAVREERDVRQSILKEIRSRLRSMESSSDNNDAIQEGPWSIFAFNFSSALFFYSVDFSNSYFPNQLHSWNQFSSIVQILKNQLSKKQQFLIQQISTGQQRKVRFHSMNQPLKAVHTLEIQLLCLPSIAITRHSSTMFLLKVVDSTQNILPLTPFHS